MMKRLLLLIIIFPIYGQEYIEEIDQEQLVHQHIVREAYQYLKTRLGYDIPVVLNHLGTTEKGTGPFNPGGKIVIGAWREDEEDPVYGNLWPNVSSTHFWNPDQGDGSHFCNSINQCFPNAYKKALLYINGGWELSYITTIWGLPNNQGVPCATQNAKLKLTYNSLIDMYKNKKIYITGVEFFGGGTVNYNPPDY